MPPSKPINPPSPAEIRAVFRILGALYTEHPLHVQPEAHFEVLVGVMLSSRTRDPDTNAAMKRLWQRAGHPRAKVTPQRILAIPERELAALLHPVGFYNTKAKSLRALCEMLIERFGGEVPGTREELLQLPGVGRKVANLVLNIAFNVPAVCVDVHVQRVTNRLGWIATATPEETEYALMELLPQKLWAPANLLFVNHGQQVCQPVSPWCSKCKVYKHCARVGVRKSR